MRRGSVACFLFLSLLFPWQGRGEETASREEIEAVLSQGEVFSEGGYEGKTVWGRMVGVIQAPPGVVWEVYIEADRWAGYNIPQLTDSRIVSRKIAEESAPHKNIKRFYEILGDQSFPINHYRKWAEHWVHHQLQYFDVPWPLSNRWMVTEIHDDESNSESGIYRAEWSRIAGNVRSMDGFFLLTPYQGSDWRTRLEYYVKTDPDGHVPKFMVRWGIQRIMPQVVRIIDRESVAKYKSYKKPLNTKEK